MEYKWCETNFFERVYILDIKILGRKYAGYGKCSSCKKKKRKKYSTACERGKMIDNLAKFLFGEIPQRWR